MRRYLLFSGADYYPGGGFEDFVDSFDTVENAMMAYEPNSHTWAQVVDGETGEILECTWRDGNEKAEWASI